MQYEAKVKSYVRNKEKKKESVKTDVLVEAYSRLLFIALTGVLLSRIYFNINISFVDMLAPFGIIYVMIISAKNYKEGIIALFGAIIGYVSIANSILETPIFIVTCIAIVSVNFIIQKKSAMFIKNVNLGICAIILILNGIFILKKDIVGVVVTSLIITAIFIPLYYIINFGYKCIDNFKIENYINDDEIISIEIFFALCLVGIGSIGVFEIELRNILVIGFVFFASYIGRGNLGITAGIISGFIFGVITDNLYFYITILGISSLVIFIFKETGKFINFILFNIAIIGTSFYLGEFSTSVLFESLIGSSLVLAVPNEFVSKLKTDFDNSIKKEEDCEKHFNKIKDELMGRLVDFTGVLSTMSKTLDNMVENEQLVSNNKGDELIDNLADRVCRKCDYKSTCWKREVHETYSCFRELIQSYEEGECEFPSCLKKKCLKEALLRREAEEIVNKHIANEMIKKKLAEGRKMLASHIGNMSDTVSEVVADFSSEVVLNIEAERAIRKILVKSNINFEYMIAYLDKDSRLNIKIEMMNCGGCNFCVKSVVPLISKALGRTMKVCNDCMIDARTNLCEVHIQEAPKYHVETNVALSAKTGEKYTGDSYSFGKTKDGHHMILLCDGMGSGARAGEESKIAVELVEKFSESGFSEKTAINTINSIMNIKFSEEEKFSTLDMQKINLYDGTVKFLKVGAMESFIKRGSSIKLIDSKTLPFGVLDNPDVDEKNYKLKAGDFIITLSDGILDISKDGDLNNSWLVELLEKSIDRNPKDLANKILDTAKSFNNGKANDDMTVLVSKVYNIK